MAQWWLVVVVVVVGVSIRTVDPAIITDIKLTARDRRSTIMDGIE